MGPELRLEAEDALVPSHSFNKMMAFSYRECDCQKKIQQLKEQSSIFCFSTFILLLFSAFVLWLLVH